MNVEPIVGVAPIEDTSAKEPIEKRQKQAKRRAYDAFEGTRATRRKRDHALVRKARRRQAKQLGRKKLPEERDHGAND